MKVLVLADDNESVGLRMLPNRKIGSSKEANVADMVGTRRISAISTTSRAA